MALEWFTSRKHGSSVWFAPTDEGYWVVEWALTAERWLVFHSPREFNGKTPLAYAETAEEGKELAGVFAHEAKQYKGPLKWRVEVEDRLYPHLYAYTAYGTRKWDIWERADGVWALDAYPYDEHDRLLFASRAAAKAYANKAHKNNGLAEALVDWLLTLNT